jgi:acetylornithine deacetylase
MPGQDPHRPVNRARAAAERCGIEFQEKIVASALYTDPNSPFVQTVLGLARHQRSGTVSFGTDGVMFGELRQLLVLGPGNIAQAHTHDEFIELEQLEAGTELYRRLIAHYCQSPAR